MAARAAQKLPSKLRVVVVTPSISMSLFPVAIVFMLEQMHTSLRDCMTTSKAVKTSFTVVVVREAHGHEVFGWAVVVHLVTPENNKCFFFFD